MHRNRPHSAPSHFQDSDPSPQTDAPPAPPSEQVLLARLDCLAEQLAKFDAHVFEKLARLDANVLLLTQQRTVKDWYTTEEVAKILGKAEFTIRNYCRLGRIRAEKKSSGRGKFQSWAISHTELLRVQREGILPLHA